MVRQLTLQLINTSENKYQEYKSFTVEIKPIHITIVFWVILSDINLQNKVLHFTISALIVIASNLLSIVQNSQAAAIKEGVLTENDF